MEGGGTAGLLCVKFERQRGRAENEKERCIYEVKDVGTCKQEEMETEREREREICIVAQS